MTEEQITEKLTELFYTFQSRVNSIVDVFNDFFGEDKVDYQSYHPNWDTPLEEFINYHKNTYLYTYTGYRRSYTLYDAPEKEQERFFKEINSEENTMDFYYPHSGDILIWFPSVIITNENNKSTIAQDLYVKVSITYEGKLQCKFHMCRSTYTQKHLIGGYRHSHTPRIYSIEDAKRFVNCCTGSGPINHTINSLLSDWDLDYWNLFCLELSKYVTVESLEGIPYISLERINDGRGLRIARVPTYNSYSWATENGGPALDDFIADFIKTDILKFAFINGEYTLGKDYYKLLIEMSNFFISWYNQKYNEHKYSLSAEELHIENILKTAIMIDGVLYSKRGMVDIRSFTEHVGEKMFTFKNKDITFDIVATREEEDNNDITILNPDIVNNYLNQMLKIINYEYKN